MPIKVINEEYFWSHVDKTGNCWEWTAYVRPDGYGAYGGKSAYRVAYQFAVGPVPEGLELDHLCRNRACVNPSHLEPVTHAENMRRSGGVFDPIPRENHCKHGHEWTPENTRTYGKQRQCRACNREASRRYIARKKAQR